MDLNNLVNISLKDVALAILGSAAFGQILKWFLEKRKDEAASLKIKSEAGKIKIEGEIEMATFWKKSAEDLGKRVDELGVKFQHELTKQVEYQKVISKLESDVESLKECCLKYDKLVADIESSKKS